jgi:hypothetical protein
MLEVQVESSRGPGRWNEEPAGLLSRAKETVFADIIPESERDCTRRVENVAVDVGEVLVFVGHLMHAGSAWGDYEEETNTRIHVYFAPAGWLFPDYTDTVEVPSWIRRYMQF